VQSPNDTLEQSQLNKLDRILDKAGVAEAGQRVLEIGCGWGSCMERGVLRFRCDWTGLTISSEQLKWARERAARLNIQDKVGS
jgi:cyclopropane-fatty-acyl-phospholipid synthase